VFEELDVPIYIHPTFASEKMMKHYKGNYDIRIAGALSDFGWDGIPTLDFIFCVSSRVGSSIASPS
jgi:hypothetical protein